MKIQLTDRSRLSEINFDHLPFGEIFTDHMLLCHYKDGAWQEAQIRPYGSMTFQPGLQALHYGQSIFEGMKAYKNEDDKIFLFRPEENFKRLNRSAVRMCMPELPEEIFMNGLEQLLRLDHKWIPKGEEKSLYIRPFMFASGSFIIARPGNEYMFAIICCPTGSYYSGEVRVKVEEKYARSGSGGTGFAKAAGNYAASFYPAKLAQKEGYSQLIWTDSATHTYIEESGTMNIMFHIGDKLITPNLSEKILAGITRDSVITLAKHMGIEVEERPISVAEIIDAIESNTLKEAFGVGTAVTVSPITLIGKADKKYTLPIVENAISMKLKLALEAIKKATAEDPFGWRKEIEI